MKLLKNFLAVLVILFVLVFMILPILGALGIKFIWSLLAGWLLFLFRVLPQMDLNASSIVFTVLVSGLILALTQWLGRTLFRPESGRVWSWRWTWSLYGAMWLLFMTAMGVTGVVHQSAWLATSERKWVVSSRPSYFERLALQDLAQVYLMASLDQKEDQDKAWKTLPEVMAKNGFRMENLEHAEYVPIVLQGVVDGVLVLPRKRNSEADHRRWFYLINKAGNFRLEMSKLEAALLAARGEGEMPVGPTGF